MLVICRACGAVPTPEAAFCSSCGAGLTDAPARVVRPPPFEPELKQVTVLVCDVVNSTGLVAQLDPEAAMNRLKPVLQVMSGAVERFGGATISTLGDGIMAVFGAPLAREAHAVLACRAALAIRTALNPDRAGLSVRTGLHCGEVVAHSASATPEQPVETFGLTPHIANRLLFHAEPGEICLTESCFRFVRDHCDMTPMGRRALRGLEQPMLLYRLEGLKQASRRGSGRAAPTRLLGREAELGALTRAYERAAAGDGALACVVGAAGTGKSRLCFEFTQRCRDAGAAVFEARSQPFGGTVPLKPVADLLRAAYFGLPADGSVDGAAAAVATVLNTLDGSQPGDLAIVCNLLGVPHESPVQNFVSAATRRTRLIEIVERLAWRERHRATVLLLEDLHWLDPASVAFLAAMARATEGTRTMLLVNTREADAAPVGAMLGCDPIVLGELNRGDTRSLVDQLLGDAAGLGAIRDRVADQSGGNPFFAEELVRALAEDGVLSGRPGRFRRGPTPYRVTLPPTVQSVIAARLDNLPRPDRETLHVAAVMGKEFDLAVLRAVVGQQPDALDGAIDRLCDASFLRPIGTMPEARFAFCHPLLQDVAYATQLKARRAMLHLAIALALRRAEAERREELSGMIAFHFEEAGDPGEAAIHAARAARRVGQTDAAAAVKQWHKVRTLLAAAPRTPESDILRIEANGQIGWLGWREGLSADEARPFLEEALTWARETDPAMIPLLMLIEGRIDQVSGGDADAFVAWVRRAIALAEHHGDVGRIATLRAQLSHACGWAGLLREALAANDAALAGAATVSTLDQQLLGYSVRHWAEALRGRILLRLGRERDARHCFEQTIALSGSVDPTVGFIAHLGYVELALDLDDGALAGQHARHIAALAEKHGSAYLQIYSLTTQAYAAAAAGDNRRAVDDARQSLGFLHQRNVARELETELLAHTAECLRRVRAFDEAAAIARDAVSMSGARNARLTQCRALITLAAVATDGGQNEAGISAVAALTQARTLLETTGAGLYHRRFNAECARAGPHLVFSEGSA